MADSPSVLIVEDHKLLRFGLRVALERLNCCRIVGEADDGEMAVREALRLQPEIILMDVGLPGIDGIEATWRVKRELPHTRVVMFTAHTEPADVMAALGAGAEGYCVKDTAIEQVAAAIAAVTRGEIWLDPSIAEIVLRNSRNAGEEGAVDLTDSERKILEMIRAGVANEKIALGLDANTEKLARIMGSIINKFIADAAGPDNATVVQTQGGAVASDSGDWLRNFIRERDKQTIFADKYELGEMLGSGGIGAVFKARHIYMDRDVAVKLIRPELSESRLAMRNFQREAMAVANLHHKNIVEVYDFGISSNNEPFMVMEFVNGRSLGDLLEAERNLSEQRLVDLGSELCLGLEEAHDKGIVHCDIKPTNILVIGTQPKESVKVVDFGLAQMVSQETPAELQSQSQSTDRFYVSGTPCYMSPEQCFGGLLDARSDIYSLGCVFYEALTGEKVFKAATPAATFEKHCYWTAPPMSEVCPQGSFSPAMEQLVAKMLERDPDLRPQTMESVRLSLLCSGADH
ncbi:MAG: protein kinase [Cyanobacteria bacterium SZAS TMP-1]|nr:protein kinase [Cyanobacteria bacterium SZAS TMP-1]